MDETLRTRTRYGREFTVEAIKNSSLVAHPVRLLHCSPVTDGASALIITSPEKAKEFTDDPIYIISSQQATDAISLYSRESLTSVKTTKLAVGVLLGRDNICAHVPVQVPRYLPSRGSPVR